MLSLCLCSRRGVGLLRRSACRGGAGALLGGRWRSGAGGSSGFETQRVLLNRQTARPVLFDELDSDDELDFSLEQKPSGAELYEQQVHNLHEDEDDYFDESDEGQDPLPDMKVGKQLLRLGKVQYRRIEYLPDWVMERKHEISGHRTPRQVRRCIKNWMLKPDRSLQQEYAFKPLGWDKNTSSPINNVNVEKKKGKSSNENSTPFVYGAEETVAYCNFFFPSRFAITQRIFRELKMLMPKYQPNRILDLGCGIGTVGAAAVDVWGSSDSSVKKYVGIDHSSAMLDAARIMTKQMGVLHQREDEYSTTSTRRAKQYTPSSSARGKRSSSVASMRNRLGRPIDVLLDSKTADSVKRIQRGGDKERFDMAVAAYTLSELKTDATKRAAVQVLYEALDVNGILVLIDNGSPIGSHGVRTARQYLLDMFSNPSSSDSTNESSASDVNSSVSDSSRMFGKTAEVKYVLPPPIDPETLKPYRYEDFMVKVLAPCTHDKECPLKPGAWCSFKQKTQSSMIRKASEEKFSYVILQKQLINPPLNERHPHCEQNDWTQDSFNVDRERDPTPLATLQRFLEVEDEAAVDKLVEDLVDEVDWDDYNPPLFRDEYGRIIRSPLKKKGHVILDTCQSDGNLTRSVLSKSEVWQVPTLYSALRKLRWGGIVPVLPLQPQKHFGSLSEKQKYLISEEYRTRETGEETGFIPSSFIGQSPMSKKSAALDLPLKEVKPPSVKVGRRSPIWQEDEGLKKNDRNRNYQGQGGMVMDEDRGYFDNIDLHEVAEMSKLHNTPELFGSKDEMHDDVSNASSIVSPWDVVDEDVEDSEVLDNDDNIDNVNDDFSDDEDKLSEEKLNEMSLKINEAVQRLRKGDLPSPEDEGMERFYPDNFLNENDSGNNDNDSRSIDSFNSDNFEEQLNQMTPSEIADMDILKQLQQHHTLDSLETADDGSIGDMKNIEWDKVFADLQKDGAFDDIDMSALEELESKMQNSNWDDIQGDFEEDMKNWEGDNGLDMDAFEKMLNPEKVENDVLKAPSTKRNLKRSNNVLDDDDDEQEIWQKGLRASRPGASVVINADEGGHGRKQDMQGLKKLDKLAKTRLDTLRDATVDGIQSDNDSGSRRGRRRRPAPVRSPRRS